MRVETVDCNTVLAEDGGKRYLLEYRMLVESVEVCGTVLECYGVEVCVSGDTACRSRRIRGITNRRNEIEMIYTYLVRGQVFPEELEEILEVLLEEKILSFSDGMCYTGLQ